MEIPRHWREQPTRMRFEGREKRSKDSNISSFKYPGGEILLTGEYQEIRERFKKKGFSSEVTDEILFRLWGGIPAESTVSLGEVVQSFHQFVGSEVGE
ncbi:MAG: hypothetical protein ACD_61C00023G0008 [uncultured bacterium]|nr:MAG: hypothetical protein ACD_61C00023G0008 [uncultured bacterium]